MRPQFGGEKASEKKQRRIRWIYRVRKRWRKRRDKTAPLKPSAQASLRVQGSTRIEAGRMGGIITPDAHRLLYPMEAKRLLRTLYYPLAPHIGFRSVLFRR